MSQRLTGRRNVLTGAAGIAGAGALAACSSPPVPTTAAPDAAGAGSAVAGRPISEIPVGGGKIFPDTKVVVTQPAAGTLKAFSTTCTHQGCAVTSIRDGQIICPCHGSAFDIESGAPTPDSQAKRPLEAKSVTVSGDSYTLS
ncbi:Rieske (2Fe-2S) protein [Intrasporangium calvum]|uniref:Cytochrome bc1 complex Rieske iron-sulfur subunit n=1 Tax=Intrasporangium calvum TaxID=53358 RepID=A0ABT5GC44_9MICO|nr:Rieske (2Fe-2S) protein [Intrasporangium calvum]MDC5695849.1 Rieske (2Fe-2S) protein [Intrasporangium calvum]